MLNLLLSCFGLSALYTRIYCQVTQPAGLVLLYSSTEYSTGRQYSTVRQWKVRFNLTENASAPSPFPSSSIIYLWCKSSSYWPPAPGRWRLSPPGRPPQPPSWLSSRWSPCRRREKNIKTCSMGGWQEEKTRLQVADLDPVETILISGSEFIKLLIHLNPGSWKDLFINHYIWIFWSTILLT